jgi:hypothetical protein
LEKGKSLTLEFCGVKGNTGEQIGEESAFAVECSSEISNSYDIKSSPIIPLDSTKAFKELFFKAFYLGNSVAYAAVAYKAVY